MGRIFGYELGSSCLAQTNRAQWQTEAWGPGSNADGDERAVERAGPRPPQDWAQTSEITTCQGCREVALVIIILSDYLKRMQRMRVELAPAPRAAFRAGRARDDHCASWTRCETASAAQIGHTLDVHGTRSWRSAEAEPGLPCLPTSRSCSSVDGTQSQSSQFTPMSTVRFRDQARLSVKSLRGEWSKDTGHNRTLCRVWRLPASTTG